jgi:hypothetical protein
LSRRVTVAGAPSKVYSTAHGAKQVATARLTDLSPAVVSSLAWTVTLALRWPTAMVTLPGRALTSAAVSPEACG